MDLERSFCVWRTEWLESNNKILHDSISLLVFVVFFFLTSALFLEKEIIDLNERVALKKNSTLISPYISNPLIMILRLYMYAI